MTTQHDSDLTSLSREELAAELLRYRAEIRYHRDQRADDRCIEDDDRLYALLPDGIPCDRRIGSPQEMHANCWRFILNRCLAGGPWKSYAELSAELAHWQANHDEMVARNQLLRERPDLPVDRLPAHAHLVKLQQFKALAHRLLDEMGVDACSDQPCPISARLLLVRNVIEQAKPIVDRLREVGTQTNWEDGDETDRVYPWYEIEPLASALAALEHYAWPSGSESETTDGQPVPNL